MEDQFAESAKAVQEIAKTSRTAIESTEKLGRFVSKITGESIEAVTGILSDKLRFMRWERQIRLRDRMHEVINERGLEGRLNTVSPKLALPIIEHASLEENDELQDLWANLLASALDPNFNGMVRAAFIDIIKQLEVVDVHILNLVYSQNEAWHSARRQRLERRTVPNFHDFDSTLKVPVTSGMIRKDLNLDKDSYENSIDNLLRVRCIASFIGKEEIKAEIRDDPGVSLSPVFSTTSLRGRLRRRTQSMPVIHTYEKVNITALGSSFVEACTKQAITKEQKPNDEQS